MRLRDLIDAALPALERRTDFERVAVVAESREGDRADSSWNGSLRSPLGDGVLPAWHGAGAPPPEHAAPVVLAGEHDRATGPRCMQRLATVDPHKLC